MHILLLAAVARAALLTPDAPWGVPGNAVYLSQGCTWSSATWNITVPAAIPGDLVTDLQHAGVIGDPYFELGFLNTTTPGFLGAPLWDVGVWTLTAPFDAAALLPHAGAVFLVLDGVKMAADVSLNGVALGAVFDQFLRYAFLVPAGLLRPTGNALALAFGTSRDPRNAEGRFSGASGGWDWGALTATSTTGRRVGGGAPHTFSKGPWRDVYLAALPPGSGAIEHVSPYVFHLGPYPTAPLTDATAGPWRVDVRVQLRGEGSGTLAVAGAWGATNSTRLTLPGFGGNSTAATVALAVPRGGVALWWPNELGAQALHGVTATWTPDAAPAAAASSATRSIGFRTFAIVTADDTHPAALAGVDGSGNLTVRWKCNGADLNMRGADIIPLEVLDGRSSDVALRIMVKSAQDAHFNVLRVDGIDTYLPDAFYAACDAAGILVYQDMQYSQGSPAPTADQLQFDELVHTVRRLAHHPSLAVYDGCNECGGHGLYASFVMTTVAGEDASRPPWPASPSNGWLSGVDRLTSLPNGSPLGLQPTAPQEDAHARGGAGKELAATLRAAAVALAAGGGGGNCTLLPNLDICPGESDCFALPHPPAASPQACCDACAAAAAAPRGACAASTFAAGTCWFKPAGRPLVYTPGAVLCWPSREPLPPLPTPGPLPPLRSREQHGPYEHGSGFAAVNGNPAFTPIGNGPMPPQFFGVFDMGPALPGLSVSEFGCPAATSFESLSPTLAPRHWSLHGGEAQDECIGGFFRNCSGASGLPFNPMAQRNYPMDSIIAAYFGMGVLPSLDAVGAAALQRQLYFALLAPALQQKSHIEAFRAYPVWMTAFWQLNGVWPTNDWGSVEYGPAGGETPGQVVGGRWRPLHYWLKSHLFAAAFSACDASGACVVRNDNPLAPLNATLAITAVSTITGAPAGALSAPRAFALRRGAGALGWGCIDGAGAPPACAPPAAALARAGCAANGTDCAVLSVLTDAATGAVLARNLQFWAPPSALAVARGARVAAAVGARAADGSVPVTLTVEGGAALLVLLSSAAQGRWSDNALQLLAPGVHEVALLPMLPNGDGGGAPPVDAALLQATLRVEHLGLYL